MWREKGVELEPDRDHCIESRAREAHGRIARRILTGEKVEEDELRQVELLEEFLNKADFRRLRRETEALILEGRRVRYFIYHEGREIKWAMRPS